MLLNTDIITQTVSLQKLKKVKIPYMQDQQLVDQDDQNYEVIKNLLELIEI